MAPRARRCDADVPRLCEEPAPMRPDLCVCYANTPLRHYTEMAVAQTLCRIPRHIATPFSTAPANCIACIAIAIVLAGPSDPS